MAQTTYTQTPQDSDLISTSGRAVDLLIDAMTQNTSKTIVCSAFGTPSAPDLPASLTRTKAIHQPLLRDFLVLYFHPKDAVEENSIKDALSSFVSTYNHPDYIFYPSDKYPNKREWTFVVQTSRLLSKAQYKIVIDFLIHAIGLTPLKTGLYNLLQNVSAPTAAVCPQAIYSQTGQPLLIEDAWLAKNGAPDQTVKKVEPSVRYSPDEMNKAAAAFAAQPDTANLLKDDAARDEFFQSLAAAVIDGLVDQPFVDAFLPLLSKSDSAKAQEYKKNYDDALQTLNQHPDQRVHAQPIGAYLQLYKGHQNAVNIAQQMLASFDPSFHPDPDLKLADAANMIALTYPPSIIDQPGADKDNVVIFNPLTGIWTHDEDLFYSLLTAVRPYSASHQLDTLMRTFAAQARNANRYIHPYSGSRYLLFRNGVLDLVDDSFLDLTDDRVRRLNFIERSQLDINYNPNPELPVLAKTRQCDGGDWNPRDFISAYGGNDPDKIRYFLFGLALGLFGGHNFGVHFDIQGESRWGKTTLSEIFAALYKNRIVTISFPSLNGRFPFTSYPLNTSIVWIKESNIGTDPLDDEHGTITYDSLADNQARFEIKGTNDIVVANPPPVFVDGTQLIQAKEINTGPAGRTLAYKLPAMSKKLRDQAYANGIADVLHREDVLQWLVVQMIRAYKSIVPANRLDDFKINLSYEGDLSIIPDFAQAWRQEFASDATDLNQWFVEEVDPYLSEDEKHPSLMHDRILYQLYDAAYIRDHPHDTYRQKMKTPERFNREIKSVIEQHGWRIHPEGSSRGRHKTLRKRVTTLSALHFDWGSYEQSYRRPNALKDTSQMDNLFGQLAAGWYTLHRIVN